MSGEGGKGKSDRGSKKPGGQTGQKGKETRSSSQESGLLSDLKNVKKKRGGTEKGRVTRVRGERAIVASLKRKRKWENQIVVDKDWQKKAN